MRMPGESDADYAEFLLWLQSPRPRALPACPAASVWQWSERARAADMGADEGAPALLAGARLDVLRVIRISAGKHLHRELTSPATLTPTELARLLAVVTGLSDLADSSGDLNGDLSELSEEELKILEKAERSLRARAPA